MTVTVVDNDVLGLAGRAVSVPEAAHIQISLLDLAQTAKAPATFWGRVSGYSGDYYVAQSSRHAADAAAAALDLSARTSFYSADGGLTWAPLPSVAELTDEQREFCDQLRGPFIGQPAFEYKSKRQLPAEEQPPAEAPADEEMPEEEPDAADEEGEEEGAAEEAEEGEEDEAAARPPRPKFRIIAVGELVRLAHFVAGHDAACAIVPRGAYLKADPEDPKAAPGAAAPLPRKNRGFRGLTPAAAAELRSFSRLPPPRPPLPELPADLPDPISDPDAHQAALDAHAAARAEALAQAGPTEADFARRAAGVFGPAFNPAWDFLPLAVDDMPGDVWSLKSDPGAGVVVLQNLFYPGSLFWHRPGTPDFGQLYFGNGERQLDLCFALP